MCRWARDWAFSGFEGTAAFFDIFFQLGFMTEDVVVMLGEAVGLIADVL